MEIEKLKRRLLKEELKRRHPNRGRNRWIGLTLAVVLICGGSILYLEKRDDLLQTRFDKALKLMHEEQFESSVKAFDAIYRSRPDSKFATRALFYRGEILNISLKRYQEALVAYLLLLKNYPQSDMALRSQEKVAQIYKYRLQDNASAIVAYQNLLDAGTPHRADTLYEIADSYFKLNNFEQARIEFEGFLAEHPDSRRAAEVRYRIGVCLSIEGELKKSEQVFRGVIETWPDDPYSIEARFALGEVLEEQERLRESLRIFEDLQGSYPNPAALERKLTQVKERIEKKRKAI